MMIIISESSPLHPPRMPRGPRLKFHLREKNPAKGILYLTKYILSKLDHTLNIHHVLYN